jgi:DNA-binding NtrC family response regulator
MRQPSAIVVCSDDTRAKRLLQMMRTVGLSGRSVASMDELQNVHETLTGQLLFYDLDSMGMKADEVLELGAAAEAHVVVLMKEFDSKEWISLFRAGAADILRYPITVEQIEQVVSGLTSPRENGVRSGSDPISRGAGWLARIMLAGKRLLHL